MNLKDRISKIQSTATVETSKVDQGLRSYMLKVYNYMSSGVLLTGIVALIVFKYAVVTDGSGNIVDLTPLGNAMYQSALMWVVALAPLGIVFYMSFGINKIAHLKLKLYFDIRRLMGASYPQFYC